MRIPNTSGLDVQDVHKRYGATRALRGVSLCVAPGEIHGLVGSNGSGKSSLVEIIAGVIPADTGLIRVGDADSRPLSAWSSRAARASGVHVVHQHQGLFPDLTIEDNLAAGHGYLVGRGGRIRWGPWRDHCRRVLNRFGVNVDLDQPLSTLRPAQRTMVAIARALQDEAEEEGLLILDEPTASLPREEANTLFTAVRRYAEAGRAIVFVSHRLDEVVALCDRVTVIRDGVNVKTLQRDEADHDLLAELLIGQPPVTIERQSRQAEDEKYVLRLRDACAGPLRNVDMDIAAGEIVGVAGLLSSGRSTLLKTLFGQVSMDKGSLEFAGRPVRFRDAADAMSRGVVLVPEDRIADAAFGDLDVICNISAATVGEYWKHGRFSHRDEKVDAMRLCKAFSVKAASVSQSLGSLSGGNQQKVILARWLRLNPRLVLLDEPTQGVDIGARAEIHRQIAHIASSGAAVLLVSSDFEELSMICHRVLVLHGGRVTAELSADLTAESIGNSVYVASRN